MELTDPIKSGTVQFCVVYFVRCFNSIGLCQFGGHLNDERIVDIYELQAIDIAYFVVGDVVHSVGVIDIFIRIQRRSVDHAYGEKKRETHELHFATSRLRFDFKIAILAL